MGALASVLAGAAVGIAVVVLLVWLWRAVVGLGRLAVWLFEIPPEVQEKKRLEREGKPDGATVH